MIFEKKRTKVNWVVFFFFKKKKKNLRSKISGRVDGASSVKSKTQMNGGKSKTNVERYQS